MDYSVRLFGDPVLRQRASEVDDIDGRIASMSEDLFSVMRNAKGVGLAAPQAGISKRLFVYDIGEGPTTLINPRIEESDGECVYEEGCLSLPGMSFEIVRPEQVHLVGLDIDGNEISIEADEFLARMFQHELDHLDGVLMLDLLERDERKAALKEWRQLRNAAASERNGLPRVPQLALDQQGESPDKESSKAAVGKKADDQPTA